MLLIVFFIYSVGPEHSFEFAGKFAGSEQDSPVTGYPAQVNTIDHNNFGIDNILKNRP